MRDGYISTSNRDQDLTTYLENRIPGSRSNCPVTSTLSLPEISYLAPIDRHQRKREKVIYQKSPTCYMHTYCCMQHTCMRKMLYGKFTPFPWININRRAKGKIPGTTHCSGLSICTIQCLFWFPGIDQRQNMKCASLPATRSWGDDGCIIYDLGSK